MSEYSWVIALSGLLLAAVNLWLGLRRQRFDNTMRLVERLQEPIARRDRFELKSLLARLGSSADFSVLRDDERARLSGIAGHFGLAGTLLKRGRIDRRIFLATWGFAAIHYWSLLEPYYQWRRSVVGDWGAQADDFKWLADQARAFHADQPTTSEEGSNA